MRLQAQIHRLLIPPDHPDLTARSHIGDAEIILVEPLFDGALDFATQDIGAQARLLANRASETHAVDGFEGVDHGADGFEAARHVGFGPGEGGDDGFGEVEKEGFALLGAFAFVGEGEGFVGAAAELDEVELVGFEVGAEVSAFGGVEAFFLEFDAVDFDGEDEGGGEAGADGLGDFHDEAGAVFE